MSPKYKLTKKKSMEIQEIASDYIDNLPLVISALISFLSKRSSTTKDALIIFYITKFNSANSSIWDTLNILSMSIYELVFKNKNAATSILAAIRIVKYIQKDIPNLIYHLTSLSETKKKIDIDYIYGLSENIEKIIEINKEAKQRAQNLNLISYNSSNKSNSNNITNKEIDFLSINGILPNSSYILLNKKIKELTEEYKKKKDIISKMDINYNSNFDVEKYDKIISEANDIYIQLVTLQKQSHETYKEIQIPILEPLKDVRKAYTEVTKTINIIDPKNNNNNDKNNNKNNNKNNDKNNNKNNNNNNTSNNNTSNNNKNNNNNNTSNNNNNSNNKNNNNNNNNNSNNKNNNNNNNKNNNKNKNKN